MIKNTNIWLKLKRPIIALAPMAGLSDSPFRQICRRFGADLVFSEMVSVSGLYYQAPKTLAFLKFKKLEQPVIFQLFGKKPAEFSQAAKLVQDCGASGIDINFGCPARKVVAHGGGVCLMDDVALAQKIISATVKATKLPVSIKIRTGYKNKITGLKFVQAIKDLGSAGLTVHGRTFEQGFSGPIDYTQIKTIVQEVKIPVLANGGIYTVADAKTMLAKTGAAGIALARGTLGNPWLFQSIKKGREIKPSLEELKKLMLEHTRLNFRLKGQAGLLEMRKHLAWYVKGRPGAAKLRAKLVRFVSLKELGQILSQIKE